MAAPQTVARSSRPTYIDFGGTTSYPISATAASVPGDGSHATVAASTWKAHSPGQVIVLGVDHVDLFAFAKACKSIGNFVTGITILSAILLIVLVFFNQTASNFYTLSGYESKANQIGEERFNFGLRAIEVYSFYSSVFLRSFL